VINMSMHRYTLSDFLQSMFRHFMNHSFSMMHIADTLSEVQS